MNSAKFPRDFSVVDFNGMNIIIYLLKLMSVSWKTFGCLINNLDVDVNLLLHKVVLIQSNFYKRRKFKCFEQKSLTNNRKMISKVIQDTEKNRCKL